MILYLYYIFNYSILIKNKDENVSKITISYFARSINHYFVLLQAINIIILSLL
jgi:hypothetical protein